MRYLTTAEALAIAGVVTGIDERTLLRITDLGLLDSAIHAPQARFGDTEFYSDFAAKAAVLVFHIARNHPLPDGNKRLAWLSLTMFCLLNGRLLETGPDDAVAFMVAIASGETSQDEVIVWLEDRIRPRHDEP